MTEYSRKEFRRLLDKVSEVDPSSTEYHVLMQSIEMFNAIALTIDEFLESKDLPQECPPVEDNVVPFNAPDFPAETPEEQEGHEVAELVKKVVEQQEPPKEEKTYTGPEVRKALVDARGKGVNVKEILAGFGAENFSALPAAKYGELMKKLEVIE